MSTIWVSLFPMATVLWILTHAEKGLVSLSGWDSKVEYQSNAVFNIRCFEAFAGKYAQTKFGKTYKLITYRRCTNVITHDNSANLKNKQTFTTIYVTFRLAPKLVLTKHVSLEHVCYYIGHVGNHLQKRFFLESYLYTNTLYEKRS